MWSECRIQVNTEVGDRPELWGNDCAPRQDPGRLGPTSVVGARGVSPNPGHQKRVRNDFSIFLSDSNAAPAPVATHKRHKGPRLGAGLGAGRGASRRPGPAIEDGPEFLEPLGCAQDDGGSSSPSKLGMLATRRQMQGSLKSSPRSSSRRSGDARSLAKGRSR